MTADRVFTVIMSLLIVGPALIGLLGLWAAAAIRRGNPSNEGAEIVIKRRASIVLVRGSILDRHT